MSKVTSQVKFPGPSLAILQSMVCVLEEKLLEVDVKPNTEMVAVKLSFCVNGAVKT